MAENSEISWTHATFNPWIGCVAVSPACDNCYAEGESKRRGWAKWGKDEPRHFTSDSYWKAPLKWNRQAKESGERMRVFCGSLCDVMEHNDSLIRQRRKLFDLIETTPNLDWLMLTKRPQNFRRFLPGDWIINPMPNVWGMTTVESDAYRWRIEALGDTPFAVRGLSCEPLLGDLSIEPELWNNRIDWLIAGGESGPGARPMNADWVRSLRNQCQRAKVAFHFKQWGNWCDTDQMPDDVYAKIDASGRDPGLYQIGKKAAGRLLDGRTWDELPGSAR